MKPLSPRSARYVAGATALLVWVVLASICSWRTYPPMPATVTLKVKFPTGMAGRNEPLIAAGKFAAGDFLIVSYRDENTAVFTYDSWGQSGPSSAPVTFNPASMHVLEVTMPALVETLGASTRAKAPLRIAFDGRVILTADVTFHRRDAKQIFFGLNPNGGSAGDFFRGDLFTASGRAIRGGPESFFPRHQRIGRWAATAPWQLVGVLLISLGAGYAMRRLHATIVERLFSPRPFSARTAPTHRWFIGTALLCTLAFAHVVTGGTWKFIYPDSFGMFYDHQAASLLQGRLDVPEPALSGESFRIEGKCYGYFGPTPALLRLPFTVFGIAFEKLTRPYLVLEYATCLGAIYLLLCHAVRTLSGPAVCPPPWAVLTLVGGAGLGSTLFFLSSRAYVYHEAILCGAAFALLATHCALRYLDQPQSRWWIGALGCGTLAVHARPPLGLFALGLAGAVALVHALRGVRAPRTALKPLLVGLLAIMGVLSFNGLSYLKFKTIEGCPLRYNVQYDADRLARIDGRQFHWGNLHFGIDSYLLKPTLQVDSRFPYFRRRGVHAAHYRSAKIDLAESMTGLPWAMPALCVLALAGLGGTLVRGGAGRMPVLLLWAAIMMMAVPMFAAIAVSHRYTADFVPFLVTASAYGIAFIGQGAEGWRRALRVLATVLTLLSILITLGLTLGFQGEGVWGVPDDVTQRYRAIQKTMDGWFRAAPP